MFSPVKKDPIFLLQSRLDEEFYFRFITNSLGSVISSIA
jgi:hypothetical protein